MMQELSFIFTTFVAVFVIVDPFAVVPVYLALTDRFSREERRTIRLKACLVAFGILAIFGITGMAVFDVFGITIPAFQIAGGILLLQIGIAQLNAKRPRGRGIKQDEVLEKDDISIFPIATPLIAGPGAISTIVLASSRAPGVLRHVELVLALFLVMLVTYICLKGAPIIYRFLGETGLNLLTRIMGIILTAVSVQFILNGIKGALPYLK